MRLCYTLSLLLAATSAVAQAPAAGLTCKVAPVSNTPGDQAFLAGAPATSESLFTAQLAASPTIGNFAGLVRAQLDLNKLVEARATATQAVNALPSSADALALMGDVQTRSGEVEDAGQTYQRALTLDRCSAQAHFGISHVARFSARRLAANAELTFAHRLAPADPAIMAEFLEAAPAAQRTKALHTFLDSHPALPPAQLQRLQDDLAALDAHLTCTAVEVPNASLGLKPILQNGRYTRSWGLSVRINDANLPLLELDTTADGIILNTDDAAKAHVQPLGAATATPDKIYKGFASQIRIGDLDFRDCPVTVVPNKVVDGRNSLIGTSFFRDHVIHIDYVAMTLTLTPLPTATPGSTVVPDRFIADDEKSWSPVYIAGPHILVPTAINKKGPYLLALDTGVGHTILSTAVTSKELSKSSDPTLNLEGYAGSMVKVIPKDGGPTTDVVDVRGPDGELLPVYRPVKLPVFRFAGNELPDDSVVTFSLNPLSHADGIEVAGLLGFHILSYYSLDINYRDGLARILFDQNRRYHVRQSTIF